MRENTKGESWMSESKTKASGGKKQTGGSNGSVRGSDKKLKDGTQVVMNLKKAGYREEPGWSKWTGPGT